MNYISVEERSAINVSNVANLLHSQTVEFSLNQRKCVLDSVSYYLPTTVFVDADDELGTNTILGETQLESPFGCFKMDLQTESSVQVINEQQPKDPK